MGPCKVNVTAFGLTYFARVPLHSYFDEYHKNEIYFLTEFIKQVGIKDKMREFAEHLSGFLQQV